MGSWSQFTTGPSGLLRVKGDVLIGSGSNSSSGSAPIVIEQACIFAPALDISDGTHKTSDPSVLTRHAPVRCEPVRSEKNVWLGNGAQVLMGVSLGEDSDCNESDRRS
ncbi:MAG: hypothetical protein EXR75_16050 [Myxococcales bacterium]|nr:hypothetical protein [Myxococcales bacterium]